VRAKSIRLVGIRCFADTSDINLGARCSIFIGQNNTGKSTLLKSLLSLQGFPFSNNDIRPGSPSSFCKVALTDAGSAFLRQAISDKREFEVFRVLRGDDPFPMDPKLMLMNDDGLFGNIRPDHTIVPFLSKRKAPQFTQDVSLNAQKAVTGTFSNLYSRIDLLATAGAPKHESFQDAVNEIVGLPITTKATQGGKEAGFYFDDDTFVSLERMGDGVTEMVSMIVELCLEKGKIFVLEEPEIDLHPRGLKALLGMMRLAAANNQFVISTHSNIVLRELGYDKDTRLYRVFRESDERGAPSIVEEIPYTPSARMATLRELGYEFADLGLHEGWLFLEESSAETIFNEILIPAFTPGLEGRLRTFSAGGATNIEPSVAEFQRLVTFVHLEPAYKGRLWVRADGDEVGKTAIASLRDKFPYLTDEACAFFSRPDFELYYPSNFTDAAAETLLIQNKKARATAKQELLSDVLNWTRRGRDDALRAWEASAAEPIALLRTIEKVIVPQS
jgi:predicted ATPase